MKVMVILPPSNTDKWISREDKHAAEHNYPFPPYSAPLLCGLIKQELTIYNLIIIDGQRDKLDYEDIKERVFKENPDVIITYLAWMSIPNDKRYTEFPFPTIAMIMPQYILRSDTMDVYDFKCDYICGKEIEQPVIEGLKELAKKGKIDKTRGFWIKEGDEYQFTGEAQLADITRFPMPAFDDFKLEKYFELRESFKLPARTKARGYDFNTSKGCLFNCAYCLQGIPIKKVRYQTAEQVLKQLRFLYDNYGVNRFELYDNEFAIKMSRAKKICKLIIESPIEIEFLTNNRVELFDEELIDLLHRAGCFNIRLGIETCSPRMQKYIEKEIDLILAKKVIKKLQDAGINVHLYLTPGLPGETKEDLDMTARFVSEVEPYSYNSGPLFLIPGSKIYRQLKKEGLILNYNWGEWRSRTKLVYKNKSYKDMGEVLKAQEYLKKRIEFYSFIKKLNLQIEGKTNKLLFYFFRKIDKSFFNKIFGKLISVFD